MLDLIIYKIKRNSLFFDTEKLAKIKTLQQLDELIMKMNFD